MAIPAIAMFDIDVELEAVFAVTALAVAGTDVVTNEGGRPPVLEVLATNVVLALLDTIAGVVAIAVHPPAASA